MPRFDGTGPYGAGPRTGGGRGGCRLNQHGLGAVNQSQRNIRPGLGQGLGLGRRRGPGAFYPGDQVTSRDQESLKDHLKSALNKIADLEERLANFEKA